jgi:hypothetical protein
MNDLNCMELQALFILAVLLKTSAAEVFPY